MENNNVFDQIVNLGEFDNVYEDNGQIIAVCDEYGLEFYVNESNVTFYVLNGYVNVDMWDYITMVMEKINGIISE